MRRQNNSRISVSESMLHVYNDTKLHKTIMYAGVEHSPESFSLFPEQINSYLVLSLKISIEY